MTRKRSLFITFEGGEGAGKTTQIRLLSAALEKEGHSVTATREPGGTPEAEAIRGLLVNRGGGAWSPVAECLLFFAARTMHVERLIKPALAAGKTVISDRFADSTTAYQSYGHGLDPSVTEQVYRLALGDFAPDLTFVLDLPPEEGLKRAGKRLAASGSDEDRFERLDLDFHRRLRQGYLEIAAKNPDRCLVVDAGRGEREIAAEIFAAVKRKQG